MPVLVSTLHKQSLTLALNRPDRLNAVSEELYRELLSALVDADEDPTIRSIVLTGNGRAFCVGADLKAHGEEKRTEDDLARYVALGQKVCEQIQLMSKPVVAAVDGYAIGAGAEMAVSADFLVMGTDAQMGFPEISIGTFVGGGVTHRLPRLIGLRKATEVLALGERFTGEQALKWGLANAISPDGAVLKMANELADNLTSMAPISMARLKASLHARTSLESALKNEADCLVEVMKTHDWAEGVSAFAARRAPVFKGE